MRKITFTKLSFASVIRSASTTVGAPEAKDILRHLLIQAHPEHGVAVLSTDEQLSTVARAVDVTVEEEMVIVLPAKRMNLIADTCGDEITIEEIEGHSQIRIESDGTEWMVSKLDADLYPNIPSIGETVLTIPAQRFLRALQVVQPSICRDESRTSLLMVYFDNLGAYSTDGTRCHFAPMPSELNGLQLPSSSVKPLIELLRLCPDDFIRIDETTSHIIFQIGVSEFATRQVEATFPQIRTSFITPRLQTHTSQVKFVTESLLMSLKRAETTNEDGTGIFTFQIPESGGASVLTEILVTAQNLVGDTVKTKVNALYSGKSRSMTYNIGPLADLIKVIDTDEVILSFHTKLTDLSLLIQQEDALTAVILPRTK